MRRFLNKRFPMAEIVPEPLLTGQTPPKLAQGEALLADFRADPAVYWRSHLILAVVGGAIAGAILLAMGNPHPWVGPVAAALALGVRGAYTASETFALRWHLTSHRLTGPGGRDIRLADIVSARPFMGDVQIITRSGDKHLLKYPANSAAVADRISRAAGGRA